MKPRKVMFKKWIAREEIGGFAMAGHLITKR
jgi:hypothetical protein